MTGLSIKGVGVTLNGDALFDPLTLHVGPGEIMTVMGPSGSGKSTLLSVICGTLAPVFEATGEVALNARRLNGLPAEDRQVGILFQDDLLFPHMTVGDNLAFGLPRGLSKAERRDRIEWALAEADMAGYQERDTQTLSGGQRARIGCLRTLLAEPSAFLLDEPFSKLDSDLRDRFRRFVFDQAIARRLPVLLVTHDPDDAKAANGPILRLN